MDTSDREFPLEGTVEDMDFALAAAANGAGEGAHQALRDLEDADRELFAVVDHQGEHGGTSPDGDDLQVIEAIGRLRAAWDAAIQAMHSGQPVRQTLTRPSRIGSGRR